MKIKSLQVSNILTFKYVEDFENAPKFLFDKNFNIIIGQNGSGKSTILEIINFIFRRVLFIPYNRNQDLYYNRSSIEISQKQTILSKINNVQYYRGFRLDRNYDFEDYSQKLRIIIEIDEIDKSNIDFLQEHKDKLTPIIGFYSGEKMFPEGGYQNEYQIEIELNSTNLTYKVDCLQDLGYKYLSAYNLFKEVIDIYNEENPNDQIGNLAEPFALIGCYRNYNAFTPNASLGGGNTALKQIQNIRLIEYSKSTNAAEVNEPTIFSLVRLRMAERCFNLISTKMDQKECESAANELDFVKQINDKLKIIDLKVELKFLDYSVWSFTFSFIDIKRNRTIMDINSLSAGQKAIIHLVFEAYGRGNLTGGLVIIDEPEIHLHYQFQYEYLRVIEKLNREQGCQYILVTHSGSLINSETISNVIRLSLDKNGYSVVKQPRITTDQKWLVKILDNTRSTHAFFGSKVLLVEGEDDRYFFRAILEYIEEKYKRGITQEITVLDIKGKGNIKVWRELFESFGLKLFIINDLDASYKFYPSELQTKISTESLANQFIKDHPDVINKIENEYQNGVFILKEGNLELYIGIHNKGLANVIDFCHNDLPKFLAASNNSKSIEMNYIINQIIT